MSYIDRLNEFASQKQPEGAPTKPTKPTAGEVLSVSSVSSGRTNPRELFAQWRAHLRTLDSDVPLHGLSPSRWRQLLTDAEWLLTCFGGPAAREQWGAFDLFGHLPARDGWGGLASRLRGSRNLKMDRDRAAWSVLGVRDQFCRSAGDDLVVSGLVLIWEEAR